MFTGIVAGVVPVSSIEQGDGVLKITVDLRGFDEEIEIRDLALGVWEADDEDDLIEEITSASGWCIQNIDYEIQLK